MPSSNDRRPVPGLQDVLEVDRQCNLYLIGAPERLAFTWPEARLEIRGRAIGVNAAEAAALAFLTSQERTALEQNEELLGVKTPKDRRLRERAAALNLSPWAIWECIRLDKSGLTLPGRVAALTTEPAAVRTNPAAPSQDDLTTWREEGEIVNEEFEAYPPPTLQEYSRSPGQGGNTKALHQHRLKVSGLWYSFRAVGSKKWAYVGDRVSFEYRVTHEGYRNIVKDTFRTVDKNGTPVERGDRSWKHQLRSVPQRSPASRRARRD
jgi:hypothetical protein